jgi:hypothetical protein
MHPNFIITGTIHGSYVYVVTCTLGWDDGTSLKPKVEGMACDCYANLWPSIMDGID